MSLPHYIILQRHGQGVHNVVLKQMREGKLSQYPKWLSEKPDKDVGLSDEGIKQSAAAGTRLIELQKELAIESFGRIYCSPYKRCRQTLGHTLISAGITDQDIYLDQRLRERNWGEFMLGNTDDWVHIHRTNRKNIDPYFWQPPNGESIAEVAEGRIRNFLDTLHRDNTSSSILVCAHGDWINAFRMNIERIDPSTYSKIDTFIPNCMFIIYSRVNPKTKKISPYMRWVKGICGDDPSLSWNKEKWQEFKPQKTISVNDLIKS